MLIQFGTLQPPILTSVSFCFKLEPLTPRCILRILAAAIGQTHQLLRPAQLRKIRLDNRYFHNPTQQHKL